MCHSFGVPHGTFFLITISLLLLFAVAIVDGGDKEKYENFNCMSQDLGSDRSVKAYCDPKEKPKGCIELTGCTNPDTYHEFRGCVEKEFLKIFEEDKIDIDEVCAKIKKDNRFPKCTGCRVCHPKEGDGDYCNGGGSKPNIEGNGENINEDSGGGNNNNDGNSNGNEEGANNGINDENGGGNNNITGSKGGNDGNSNGNGGANNGSSDGNGGGNNNNDGSKGGNNDGKSGAAIVTVPAMLILFLVLLVMA